MKNCLCLCVLLFSMTIPTGLFANTELCNPHSYSASASAYAVFEYQAFLQACEKCWDALPQCPAFCQEVDNDIYDVISECENEVNGLYCDVTVSCYRTCGPTQQRGNHLLY